MYSNLFWLIIIPLPLLTFQSVREMLYLLLLVIPAGSSRHIYSIYVYPLIFRGIAHVD